MVEPSIARVQRWKANETQVNQACKEFFAMFSGEPVRVLIVDRNDARRCGFDKTMTGSKDSHEKERKRWLCALTEALAGANFLPSDAACAGMRELITGKRTQYVLIAFAVPDWEKSFEVSMKFSTQLVATDCESIWKAIDGQVQAILAMDEIGSVGGTLALRRATVEPSADGRRLTVVLPKKAPKKKVE